MNVNTANTGAGVVKGEFRQCTLVRYDNGVVEYVALIPLKWARVGRDVIIKTEDSEKWITWTVLYADTSIVVDPTDTHTLVKSHRRATGDSMSHIK